MVDNTLSCSDFKATAAIKKAYCTAARSVIEQLSAAKKAKKYAATANCNAK